MVFIVGCFGFPALFILAALHTVRNSLIASVSPVFPIHVSSFLTTPPHTVTWTRKVQDFPNVTGGSPEKPYLTLRLVLL